MKTKLWVVAGSILFASTLFAQTDMDALTMAKKDFCSGIIYQNSTWSDYWEGTLQRENLNIGNFKSHTVSAMGNYGISNKLNVLFSVPYVLTKSDAGQWKGQQGFQDVAVWLKYVGYDKKTAAGRLRLLGLAGVSTPLTNYSVDQLPYSIGLGTTNITARIMADYQKGNWFATAAAGYVRRTNAELDRDAYYANGEMHYSSQVEMADATQWILRAGYRYKNWIAEAVADNWNTLKGDDMARNNMPFLTNKMEMTRVGTNIKWEDGLVKGLSLLAGGMYTLQGRNVGQTLMFYSGVFYLVHFGKASSPGVQGK